MKTTNKKFWTGERLDFLCKSLALRFGIAVNPNDGSAEMALKAGSDLEDVTSGLCLELAEYWADDYREYRAVYPNKRYPELTADAVFQQIIYVLTLDEYTSDFVTFSQAKISGLNAGLLGTKELNKFIAGTPSGIIDHWAEKIDTPDGTAIRMKLLKLFVDNPGLTAELKQIIG